MTLSVECKVVYLRSKLRKRSEGVGMEKEDVNQTQQSFNFAEV